MVCQDDTRQPATVNMTNITVNQANVDGQQGHHVHHGQLVQLDQNGHMVLRGHHSHSVDSRIVRLAPVHNVHFGKYVYLPTEQAETYLKSCVFNIYLSLLVRLEGKHDFEGNRDFQTLNLGFPGHFDRF